MPQLIEHIDAIARKKQRGVLLIKFHPEDMGIAMYEYDHRKDRRRKKVLAWLNKNSIPWVECGPIANENFMINYLGDIYLDIPYDEDDPRYKLVCEYLENPDGTMRDKRVVWYFLSLEIAMGNAHHDEPGFWERWAENF